MRVHHRLLLAAAVLGAATAAAPPGTGDRTTAGYTEIKGSVRPAADKITGPYTASRMPVEVSLASRDQAGLNREMSELYTPGSSQYHKFLSGSQFDARYAPTAATVRAVETYLRDRGLTVTPNASSPFLINAAGSSAEVTRAFRTTLSTYLTTNSNRYFANSTPVYVPTPLSHAITSVLGLTNAPHMRPLAPANGALATAATSTLPPQRTH